MNYANGLDALTGWSHGFAFTSSKRSEDEVKQGKNYTMASWFQVSEIIVLGSAINPFVNKISHPLVAKISSFFNNFSFFLTIPYCSLAASVKEGKYNEFYNNWNRFVLILPKKMGSIPAKIFQFSAEHLGDVLRVAFIATSIAFVAIGKIYIGGAMLCALAYESIDHLGYVPRKISLFMEKKMPMISTVAFLFVGSPVQKLLSSIQITGSIIPDFGNFILYKTDKIFHSIHRYCQNYKVPTFQECEKEWKKVNELNFKDIQKILEKKADLFEINPSHLSKWALYKTSFPEIKEIDRFKSHFEKIDWTHKLNLIYLKLKDDDRFIDELKDVAGCNPSIQLSSEEIWKYFNQWAEKEGLTVNQLAISILQKKMDIFCKTLKGEIRTIGKQKDIDEAIGLSYKILGYLESRKESVETEDIILKLCVEAGDYCARGIKRALNETMDYVRSSVAESNPDPIKNFEQKVLFLLQEVRSLLIQENYHKLIKDWGVEDSIGKDIHGYDMYRIALTLGFYPLSKHERKEIGIGDIIFSNIVPSFREYMFDFYNIATSLVFKEIGEVHFSNYIQAKINTNSLLSKEEKEKLLEMYTDYNDSDATEKFQRLTLVMLGVLKVSI